MFINDSEGCKAIKISVNRNKVINILSVWIWTASQVSRTDNPTSEGSMGFFLFTDFVSRYTSSLGFDHIVCLKQ